MGGRKCYYHKVTGNICATMGDLQSYLHVTPGLHTGGWGGTVKGYVTVHPSRESGVLPRNL